MNARTRNRKLADRILKMPKTHSNRPIDKNLKNYLAKRKLIAMVKKKIRDPDIANLIETNLIKTVKFMDIKDILKLIKETKDVLHNYELFSLFSNEDRKGALLLSLKKHLEDPEEFFNASTTLLSAEKGIIPLIKLLDPSHRLEGLDLIYDVFSFSKVTLEDAEYALWILASDIEKKFKSEDYIKILRFLKIAIDKKVIWFDEIRYLIEGIYSNTILDFGKFSYKEKLILLERIFNLNKDELFGLINLSDNVLTQSFSIGLSGNENSKKQNEELVQNVKSEDKQLDNILQKLLKSKQ